jgi:hypothetical protein
MPAIILRGQVIDVSRPEGRMKVNELKAAAIRLRNFGATLGTITDTLGLESEDIAEYLLSTGLRELVSGDADSVRAGQQAVLNDIKRAMYPGMVAGGKDAAGVLMTVLRHEADIHPGVKAPARVRLGLDQDAFTTTVDEDMRALGVHPQMDVPLDEGDAGWANT